MSDKSVGSFLFHCKYEKNLSEKTLKAYKTDINQFKVFITEKGLSKVECTDKYLLRGYIKDIYKFKPKTIKRKLATLKALFNYLEFEDKIIVNPFRKIKVNIKTGQHLPSTISFTSIKKLFRCLYQKKEFYESNNPDRVFTIFTITRDIAILEILFGTGLRVSEVSNIKIENIDLNHGWIKINGKGNKDRTIPVCDNEIKQAVRKYLSYIKLKEGFLFRNRLDNKISEQSIRFMIRKYTKEAKIQEHITPHMFRHTIATLLLERGVDIMYIQSLLGHSSINTTQIYIQINEKAKKRIINKKHPRRDFQMISE
ncbi:MAG: tyrosine-type recombinase/integrase [Candidatus Delongbacteria bacterium]|jgi:integrase/recombinase XerD|nr:tyrosine-type recombinase/integrase [Candidatus Delongbacteria bacterium]